MCCAEGGNRSFCFLSPTEHLRLSAFIRVHPRSSVANLPRLFLTAAGPVAPTKLGLPLFVGFVRFVVSFFGAVNGYGLPLRINFHASKTQLAAAA